MTRATSVTPELLRTMPLPDPGTETDKDARGRVLIVGSSARVPGAVLLSGVAALRGGAGKVALAVPRSIALALGVQFPEAGVIALPETPEGEPSDAALPLLIDHGQRSHAVLIGPGLMDHETCASLVGRLLQAIGGRFVLDASALNCVRSMRAEIQRQRSRPVLTPHSGEMAALLGIERAQVEADPERYACEVATDLDCIVALKGATTYIADQAGGLWCNLGGTVGLATSGSGDVLSGLIAGLLARGADPRIATLWGVYIHAKAGEVLADRIGFLGFLARELGDEIPRLLQDGHQV